MRNKTPLPFAEWAPDKSVVSGSASEAKGCVSLSGRYAPIKDFLALKAGAAVADRAIGGAGFYEGGTDVRTFVATTAAIYEIVARVPVDISKIGGYAANPDWAWTFEQFGENVIAAGRGVSQLQTFNLGSSSVFADLATGPGLSDGVFRIREFLFSGVGVTISNSAFNDFTDWVPDSGTQAGAFDLPTDGGMFVGGVGGQFGLIFQERKVHRLVYSGNVGTPFSRDEIEDKRGALGPHAYTRYGSSVFFASEDGFFITDGNKADPIGDGKVDRYFASRLNYAQRARVSMSVDVEQKRLEIIFPTGGNSRPTEKLIYSDGRWTHDDCEQDLIFEAPRPGISINDDEAIEAVAGSSIIDEVNIPVDSSVWRESRKQIMAVNYAGEVGTFEGPNRAATLETGYGEVAPSRLGFVSEVWPITDAASCTVSITTKLKRLSDDAVDHPISAMNTHGFCPVLCEARWLKARQQIPYDQAWTEATGINWDVEPSGEL